MKKFAGALAVFSVVAIGIGIVLIAGVISFTNNVFNSHKLPKRAQPVSEVMSRQDFEPTQRFTLPIDGVDREFIVYRPSTLSPNQPVPVVFMFHGASGTGSKFYSMSGWREVADAQGIMAIFPTGLKYHLLDQGGGSEPVPEYETRWASYTMAEQLDPDYPDQVIADDVTFVREMFKFLQEQYAIDEQRVYAAGFSNGGNFVNRLMLEASDVFAAYASASSGFELDSFELDTFEKPEDFVARPMITMLGTRDAKLTAAAGVRIFPFNESAVEPGSSVKTRFVDAYVDMLGLTDDYTYERQGKVASFTFVTPASDSITAAEYKFLLVDGLGHEFPNGNNYPLKGAEIYWEFFDQYTR